MILFWQNKTTAELVFLNMPLSVMMINFLRIFPSEKKQFRLCCLLVLGFVLFFLWNAFAHKIELPIDFQWL